METKRHTCIICGKKRYSRFMKMVLVSSWVCNDSKCLQHHDIKLSEKIRSDIQKLKKVNIKHIIGGR